MIKVKGKTATHHKDSGVDHARVHVIVISGQHSKVRKVLYCTVHAIMWQEQGKRPCQPWLPSCLQLDAWNSYLKPMSWGTDKLMSWSMRKVVWVSNEGRKSWIIHSLISRLPDLKFICKTREQKLRISTYHHPYICDHHLVASSIETKIPETTQRRYYRLASK